MRFYYLNPTNHDLIILDSEKGEILIVEKIQKIRAMSGQEIKFGDFDGPNPNDTQEDKPLYRNHNYDPKSGKAHNRKKGMRICKNCGQPGHFARTCTNEKST